MRHAQWAAATVLAMGILAALPAIAGDGVQQSCWTPAALAGKPDEKHATLQRERPAFPSAKPAMEPSNVMGTVRRVKLPPGTLQVHWPEGNVLLSSGPEHREPQSHVPDYTAVVSVERA